MTETETGAEWYPADPGNLTRQQSVVHTQLERWEPAIAPVYATEAPPRFGTTTVLVQHASPRVRVVVANVLLALLGTTVAVFAVALILAGVHLWAWLT